MSGSDARQDEKKTGGEVRTGRERERGEEERWTEEKKGELWEKRIGGAEVQSRQKGSDREMPLIRSSERFFSLTHSAGGL